MKTVFGAAMRHATKLTRAQSVIEATRVIQRALSGRAHDVSPDQQTPESPRLITPPTNGAESADAFEQPRQDAGIERSRSRDSTAEQTPSTRMRRPLGEVLTLLRQANLPSFGHGPAPFAKSRNAPLVLVPQEAAYLTRTFTCEAGSRDYKVYVPSRAEGRTLPLVIMLHGCTQNPDDFAVGTGMNRLSEEHGFIVAYPWQPIHANQSGCWNWFNIKDQMRDAGEPSIIAGITRTIMADFNIDAKRVYVAGLSAGGAMAAIMSVTYPELYAATGIHSGLAHGSATDVVSAFAAMRGGPGSAAPGARKSRRNRANDHVRTIIFHGASDQTVHPSNAETILAEARAGLAHSLQETQHDGSMGGRAYTRRVIADANGVPHAEHWAIEGLGHAWSGGSRDGSYTDQRGPDASREMLRFFEGGRA
jgi:poly(hydroxyalkanoate) depolymerase family esterase